ncbi:MAG: DUF3768 domain-containing protein [Beijerinckiaceae bacterium]|nr:DUF3768 domain-containing protein [Beijerinckiaceae bacterium]
MPRCISETARAARIRDLNDAFRTNLKGGQIIITDGVAARGLAFHQEVFLKLRGFDSFEAQNDPYGEHDFGALTVRGKKVFFKIDYYDRTMQYGSDDPADAAVTTRVLTIMLAEEY